MDKVRVHMEMSVAEKCRSLLFSFRWWLTDGEFLFVYAGGLEPDGDRVPETSQNRRYKGDTHTHEK